MILKARNGGSITPRYRKILDTHIASGKISLHTHTALQSLSWNGDLQTWTSVSTIPELALPTIDYIIFATGIQSNIHSIPFLQTLHQQHPIECVGGLPCLNDDLMWSDDVPLFVTGRLAGLRLGPGAPNLVGARVGAERIVWNVENVLEKLGRGKRDDEKGGRERDSGDEKFMEYATGRRNRFDSLVNVA
jgi:hypothetical protein